MLRKSRSYIVSDLVSSNKQSILCQQFYCWEQTSHVYDFILFSTLFVLFFSRNVRRVDYKIDLSNVSVDARSTCGCVCIRLIFMPARRHTRMHAAVTGRGWLGLVFITRRDGTIVRCRHNQSRAKPLALSRRLNARANTMRVPLARSLARSRECQIETPRAQTRTTCFSYVCFSKKKKKIDQTKKNLRNCFSREINFHFGKSPLQKERWKIQ